MTPRLSRRQLLAGIAALPAVFVHARAAVAKPATPLPIPKLSDATDTGGKVSFAAQKAQHVFGDGMASDTYGYSASFLGPVIKVKSGTTLGIDFRNELDVPTAVHWHGVMLPSEFDGGPHNPVAPGASWQPQLPITQAACTAWFHPHPHGDTARQVYMGLAGMIIIEDDTSPTLGLPDTYGVNDLPLILQDRAFDGMGMMVYDASPMSMMHGARGAQVIVNGAIAPQAKVPRGLTRLRLLNGANARNFWLRFADARPFNVIASDNGFLAKPVQVNDLVMAPGERYEVLVNFADGKPATLQTYPDYNGNFKTGTISALSRRLASMKHEASAIMSFAVDDKLPRGPQEIPDSLITLPVVDETKAIQTRRLLLDPMTMTNMPMMQAAGQGNMAKMDHSKMDMSNMKMGGMKMPGMGMQVKMGINGKSFDMARIDAEPALGSSEIWEVEGEAMAHPFHIHGATFRVLELDGAAPPDHQRGWKDTVLVNQKTRLLVKFDQPATAEKPFMYHCHILEHEDAGMMAQYRTV